MNATAFTLNPGKYGVPTRDELVAHRIWDTHYHGFNLSRRPTTPVTQSEAMQLHYEQMLAQHRAAFFYSERMGIERVVALDIGGMETRIANPGGPHAALDAYFDGRQRQTLVDERDRLSGLIRIHPGFPEASCAKMEQWIRHGPCIGIKYSGIAAGVPCSHPNNDVILRLARELHAIVYVHAWFLVGGEPRTWTGGMKPGESTPLDVALLAKRFPDVTIICGHSGGDWELGARAVRDCENVLFEFSGSDPQSGEVDFAVSELGADRIVWGGHGPTRSYATELSKVFEAKLTRTDRMKILGGNYRRAVQAIFRAKGYPLTV